jgi:3-oxoacyl-[acyl-carrier protein] reductase
VELDKITFEQARADQIKGVAAKGMGDPREFGAICAFLCSAHAEYISGQSIHVVGGSYPALI